MANLLKDEIEQIKFLLDTYGELPQEFKWKLFPNEKQECELVYGGKKREEDILADTMAVPLQAIRSFNNGKEGWHNRLIFGDNLQVMKSLLNDPQVAGNVKLVYIDPPFASKQEFRGSKNQKAYQDKVDGAEFVEFIRVRLILLRELMAPDGVIFIHLDQRKARHIRMIADEVFGEGSFKNEIIWKRTPFAGSSKARAKKFPVNHDIILMYSKGPKFFFQHQYLNYSEKYLKRFKNKDDIDYYRVTLLKTYSQKTFERLKSEDRLIAPVKEGAHWSYKQYLHQSKGKQVEDIWIDIGGPTDLNKFKEIVKSNFDEVATRLWETLTEGQDADDVWTDVNNANPMAHERVDYPNLKPEDLLARIIRCCSEEGDLILDCFTGSGTTLAVAEKLKRRWIGVDCGKLSMYIAQKRLLNLREDIGNKGKKLKAKPFTLYHAGLYDFSSLKQLPWEGWRFFALQLFECKDKPQNIGGLHIDGEKKGAPVLVFNWKDRPGERISEETIDDIHAAVGRKIGTKFYIIAPKLAFDFQQDYVDRDDVRYYALHIPYSIINELHTRDFQAVLQAKSKQNINDIQDSYGFSFMIAPEVEFETYYDSDDVVTIETKEFVSKAKIKGNELQGGMETLTMLLVDVDYDGNVFDLDYAYFAEELNDQSQRASFPYNEVGDKVMAIWIDHHGNEFSALINKEDFTK